jgi:hypothetical protein
MIHLKNPGTIYGNMNNCSKMLVCVECLFQNATLLQNLLQNMLQNMQHVLEANNFV